LKSTCRVQDSGCLCGQLLDSLFIYVSTANITSVNIPSKLVQSHQRSTSYSLLLLLRMLQSMMNLGLFYDCSPLIISFRLQSLKASQQLRPFMGGGPCVGIATGYELDDGRVGVRGPVEANIFFSPRRPDRFLGPPSLLLNVYRG
jgi:hypothetical protein